MQGNTATIVFGTSSWPANVHMIGGTSQTRPKIEDSHLATEDFQTFVPGDLVDPGELELEFEFDPDDPPPIDGAPETITITHPSALANGATLAGSGFLTEWKSGDLRNNQLAVGTAKIAWDGKTGPAWTDASA
jgi:hypothetical protein